MFLASTPIPFLPSVVWVLIPNVAQECAAGPIPTLEIPAGQIHQILSDLFELRNPNVLLGDITHGVIVYPRALKSGHRFINGGRRSKLTELGKIFGICPLPFQQNHPSNSNLHPLDPIQQLFQRSCIACV